MASHHNTTNLDPYKHLNITLNPDGTLTRHMNLPTIDANPDPTPGDPVVSKDATLNPLNDTWVRIFRPTKLPSNDNAVAKLPIILHFHRGCWLLFSVSNAINHHSCTNLASEVPAIIVSVNYRLAPESRLPAAYEDAVEAIMWVRRQVLELDGEPWIKEFGDCSRCYLYGSSNGANMALHAGLLALDRDCFPVILCGIIMNQPMFSGQERTGSEVSLAADPLLPLPVLDLVWELALPVGADRDHWYCNPMVEGPHKSKIRSLGRCLVIGFGNDPMTDRQQEFVRMLAMSGVAVEAKFDDLGFHGVEVVDSRWASFILNMIKDFIA